MIVSSFEVRTATSEEIPQTVACMVAAFVTDPLARFALPSPYDHLRGMPAATRAFAGRSFEHGTAYVSADFCGAALWLPPGIHPDGEALEQAFREHVGPERLDDLLATFEKMDASHPEEPHWYLPMIGVEPNARNRGLGRVLMQHALGRCDQDGVLAYLESSNPRNITLYERHGFEVMGQIQIGGAPVITPMLRQPR